MLSLACCCTIVLYLQHHELAISYCCTSPLCCPSLCYDTLLHYTHHTATFINMSLQYIIIIVASMYHHHCCFHHHAASMYHHHCFGASLFVALHDWLGHSNSSPNSLQNVARIALHNCGCLSRRGGKPWLQCSVVPTHIPPFSVLLSTAACYSKLSLRCSSPSKGYSFT